MTEKHIRRHYGYTKEDLLCATGRLALGTKISIDVFKGTSPIQDVGIRFDGHSLYSKFDFNAWIVVSKYPVEIAQPARIHRVFLSQIAALSRGNGSVLLGRGRNWVQEFRLIRIFEPEVLTDAQIRVLLENGFHRTGQNFEFDLAADSKSRATIREYNVNLFSS